MEKRRSVKPLSPRERASLIAAVQAAQRDEGISNSEMARILRYSSSVWSAVIHGSYQGDVDKVLGRAAEWLEHRSHRSPDSRVRFVPTGIAQRIHAVCERAWLGPTIGRIELPSGTGKTIALAEFARRVGERCVHVQAGQCFRTRKGLLEELVQRLALGLGRERSTHRLYAAVRDRFAEFYQGGKHDPVLLIIDEATTLLPDAIDMLRNLHDDPASRIGLVLADTLRLDAELSRGDGYRHGYEQTLSRCAAYFRFGVDQIIPSDDVRRVGEAILETLGHEGRLDAATWRYLDETAQSAGRLRNVEKLLAVCRDVAQGGGAEPSYSAVELDFCAPLVRLPQRFEHDGSPFSQAAAHPGAAATAAVGAA
ncbi:MAG: ATP-binding protein [Planctomycetes bacterium]|nr:ATP-binding protein [Planctomycetota bacterium]